MNAISRTNRLHQLVRQHLGLISELESGEQRLTSSFLLLVEQWVLAICCEAEESFDQTEIKSFERLQSASSVELKNNVFLSEVVNGLNDSSHWLNALSVKRKAFLEPQITNTSNNLIATTQTENLNEVWVREIENLMNNVREFSQEY